MVGTVRSYCRDPAGAPRALQKGAGSGDDRTLFDEFRYIILANSSYSSPKRALTTSASAGVRNL
jgi:hypothetical protein